MTDLTRSLAHQARHDHGILRSLQPPYGCEPEVTPLVALHSLRPVKDCPHERMTPWEPWFGMGLLCATCKDCGTTKTREAS